MQFIEKEKAFAPWGKIEPKGKTDMADPFMIVVTIDTDYARPDDEGCALIKDQIRAEVGPNCPPIVIVAKGISISMPSPSTIPPPPENGKFYLTVDGGVFAWNEIEEPVAVTAAPMPSRDEIDATYAKLGIINVDAQTIAEHVQKWVDEHEVSGTPAPLVGSLERSPVQRFKRTDGFSESVTMPQDTLDAEFPLVEVTCDPLRDVEYYEIRNHAKDSLRIGDTVSLERPGGTQLVGTITAIHEPAPDATEPQSEGDKMMEFFKG